MSMLDRAKLLQDEMSRLRRDIHAHPELAFQEVRTAALVAETLREIGGIDVRTNVGITGVVGSIGTGDGPTIGIRADMDALPIIEASGVDFSSQTHGNMHACGHDSHTAILLGVAHLLKQEFATGKLAGENEKITIKPALNEIPLYVREGSAIPTFKNTTSVAKGISSKAIQVRAYGRLACSGLLYEDDGTSFNYEKGDFGMFQLQTSDRELKATHFAGGRTTPSAQFEVIRLD
jgi:hypothetical protein